MALRAGLKKVLHAVEIENDGGDVGFPDGERHFAADAVLPPTGAEHFALDDEPGQLRREEKEHERLVVRHLRENAPEGRFVDPGRILNVDDVHVVDLSMRCGIEFSFGQKGPDEAPAVAVGLRESGEEGARVFVVVIGERAGIARKAVLRLGLPARFGLRFLEVKLGGVGIAESHELVGVEERFELADTGFDAKPADEFARSVPFRDDPMPEARVLFVEAKKRRDDSSRLHFAHSGEADRESVCEGTKRFNDGSDAFGRLRCVEPKFARRAEVRGNHAKALKESERAQMAAELFIVPNRAAGMAPRAGVADEVSLGMKKYAGLAQELAARSVQKRLPRQNADGAAVRAAEEEAERLGPDLTFARNRSGLDGPGLEDFADEHRLAFRDFGSVFAEKGLERKEAAGAANAGRFAIDLRLTGKTHFFRRHEDLEANLFPKGKASRHPGMHGMDGQDRLVSAVFGEGAPWRSSPAFPSYRPGSNPKPKRTFRWPRRS